MCSVPSGGRMIEFIVELSKVVAWPNVQFSCIDIGSNLDSVQEFEIANVVNDIN